MPLGEGVPTNEEPKKEHPHSKRSYFGAICLSTVHMVADGHRHAAYHNKHWLRAF